MQWLVLNSHQIKLAIGVNALIMHILQLITALEVDDTIPVISLDRMTKASLQFDLENNANNWVHHLPPGYTPFFGITPLTPIRASLLLNLARPLRSEKASFLMFAWMLASDNFGTVEWRKPITPFGTRTFSIQLSPNRRGQTERKNCHYVKPLWWVSGLACE